MLFQLRALLHGLLSGLLHGLAELGELLLYRFQKIGDRLRALPLELGTVVRRQGLERILHILKLFCMLLLLHIQSPFLRLLLLRHRLFLDFPLGGHSFLLSLPLRFKRFLLLLPEPAFIFIPGLECAFQRRLLSGQFHQPPPEIVLRVLIFLGNPLPFRRIPLNDDKQRHHGSHRHRRDQN